MVQELKVKVKNVGKFKIHSVDEWNDLDDLLRRKLL